MEEALYEMPVMRRFARLDGVDNIPDETTILNFRRTLETHDLAPQVLERVNAHLACKGLHGQEDTVRGDSGYTGARKHEELLKVKAAFWIVEKLSKLRAMKNKRERK